MEHLPMIYAAAVLLPLASFAIILLFARQLGQVASWVATIAILGAGMLAFAGLGLWLTHHFPEPVHAGGHGAAHGGEESGVGSRESDQLSVMMVAMLQEPKGQEPKGHEAKGQGLAAHSDTPHAASEGPESHGKGQSRPVYSGEYYTLGEFGPLRVTISYYIDALTVVMFCMVTFIATCIHFYAIGYMHDELTDVTDKEVTMSSGNVLHRPGRFPRFFQYLSLFCFSMLGLVLSGNIAMV